MSLLEETLCAVCVCVCLPITQIVDVRDKENEEKKIIMRFSIKIRSKSWEKQKSQSLLEDFSSFVRIRSSFTIYPKTHGIHRFPMFRYALEIFTGET